MKIYTVIYTDFGDTCDGFARVLSTHKNKANAIHEMDKDIANYRKENQCSEPEYYSLDKVVIGDEHNGCQWQILEVEVNNENSESKS